MEPQKAQKPQPPKPSNPELPPSSTQADQTHQNPTKLDLDLDLDLALDLSLRSNDSDRGFESKHSEGETQNNHSDDSSQCNEEGEPRVFSCNYCQRKFYSSQALGGHQNAHKRERTLAKRGQRLGPTAFGSYFPDHCHRSIPSTFLYPNDVSGLPLYSSNNNNSRKGNHRLLGIQAHSLIHKPSYNPVPFSSSTHHGWSRMRMIDQQPAIGRLGMIGSSSPPSNGGVARFGGVLIQKNLEPLERSITGGICWKGSVVKSNKQDCDHLHKLDLSLKL